MLQGVVARVNPAATPNGALLTRRRSPLLFILDLLEDQVRVLEVHCRLRVLLAVELTHAPEQVEVLQVEHVLVVVVDFAEAAKGMHVHGLVRVHRDVGQLGGLLGRQLKTLLTDVAGDHGLLQLDPLHVGNQLDIH